jgi:excisionase family DNA binding protein
LTNHVDRKNNSLANPGKIWQPLPSYPGRAVMADEILTLPEVAALLKVADKTVYTMAQKAEIPAFKVRGQWRFKRQDIDMWIEQQKSAQRDDPGL